MFALLPGKIYTNMWNNTNKSEHITMNMSEKHRKGHRALDLFLKNVFLQCSHTCSRCFLAKYMWKYGITHTSSNTWTWTCLKTPKKASGSGPIFEKRVFTMLAHMSAMFSCNVYTNIWNNTHNSEHITKHMFESTENYIGLRTYFWKTCFKIHYEIPIAINWFNSKPPFLSYVYRSMISFVCLRGGGRWSEVEKRCSTCARLRPKYCHTLRRHQ